jgi:hypothetical protein
MSPNKGNACATEQYGRRTRTTTEDPNNNARKKSKSWLKRGYYMYVARHTYPVKLGAVSDGGRLPEN